MTDDELKALVASLAISQQKTDAQLDKMSRKIDQLGELVGNINHNQSRVDE